MTNPLAHDLDHVLAHTAGGWDELRGQRLFITGGTGFFGGWLLETLAWANRQLNLGAEALVLSRNPAAFARHAPHLAEDRAIRFLTGDVRTFEFPRGPFSHVIHAATQASATLNADNPQLMFDTIVEGTRRTLSFAAACGAQKFLLISSGAVYGKQPPELAYLPEDHPGAPDPLDPAAAYGEGKRAAELLGALYSRQPGLETKIARGFAFVGPRLPLDAHFAIGNFIRDALRGGPIRVQGDGTPIRSYLYAADLAVWLWQILWRGQSGRAYNVGSESAISIGELARVVADTLGGGEVLIARAPVPGQPAARYVPSTRRAATELGLEPRVDLTEGIRRTAAWAARQPLPATS